MENIVRFICTLLICSSVIGSAVFINNNLSEKFDFKTKELQITIERQNVTMNNLLNQRIEIADKVSAARLQTSQPKLIAPITPQKQFGIKELNRSSELAKIEKLQIRAENRYQNDRECTYWSQEHSLALNSRDQSRIRAAMNEMRASCERARND